MFWCWFVAMAYRRAPWAYLEIAKVPFKKRNPEFLDHALSRLGENYWPLILWVMSRQYVRDGGLAKHPGSRGLENAILVDAAGRDQTPGPIRDQVEAMRQNGQKAIESLTGEEKQRLHQLIQPVLNRDKRLARRLDAEDLAQETLLRLQEFLDDPAVRWSVGKQWLPDKYWPTEDFARDVVNRLTAQKYGTDKQIERMSFDASDPELLGHGSLDGEYEAVESRMELELLIAGLPTKQREAVAAKLMAIREGVTLGEMCRRLGRNPQKDLENFKAVKRRYKH